MKVFIDLFCGLGGASDAFVNDPAWKVIRIDNNADLLQHVRGMWLLDIADVDNTYATIRAHLVNEQPSQVFVWASPPCTDFCLQNRDRFPDDLHLLDAALEIIDALQVDFNVVGWIIENVRGAITPFTEHMGRDYSQRIGPFFLWGSFIPIACADSSLDRHRKPFNSTNSRTELRSNIHARVPYALSDSLRMTLNNQRTLHGYIRSISD